MPGLTEGLEPATDMFKGGISGWSSYLWILIPVAIIITIGLVGYIIKRIKDKNRQWTHTLKVRRVLQSGLLSDPIIHNMRRFPLIKKAEIFELEKPLLGSYLLPELDEYSGVNQFSIILDKNNRIYTNKGEFFNPDKSSVLVSAKHSEIDVQRQNLKANFQNVNKISKRTEWSTIAKYAMISIMIIAVTIIAIVGLQKWSESQDYQSQKAKAELEVMQVLSDALDKVEENQNTNLLIIDKLNELYDSKNIQGIVKKSKKQDEE